MATDEESRRRQPMDSEEWRRCGNSGGCPRSVEEARPDDVHDGPRPEGGPELRENFQAFPREPAGIRHCFRSETVADAHDPSKKHAPMMFTTDLALKVDPSYAKISKHFHENPQEFATVSDLKQWRMPTIRRRSTPR